MDSSLDREPEGSNGITEAWFRFETAVGGGIGHLRREDGRC